MGRQTSAGWECVKIINAPDGATPAAFFVGVIFVFRYENTRITIVINVILFSMKLTK